MKKLPKNISLSFLVLVIMSVSLISRVEAFSFNFNPITFLQKTANIIASRVSDAIYYLVMQKKYIFDNFSDPNIYTSFNIAPGLERIISSTTADSIIGKLIFSRPIAVTTSTLPSLGKTAPVYTTEVPGQVASSVPGLVVESSPVSNPENEPISDSSGSQILNYTNEERIAMSLKPLADNSVLDTIADLRVDDMFTNQYFEHNSPDGQSVTDLAKKVGYGYLLIGENLAQGNFDGDEEIVSAWMASPGHKANILNEKYKELGVAVKEGIFDGGNTTIAVQIFSLPLVTCPKPSQNTKLLIDNSSVSIKQMQGEALVMYNNLDAMKNNPDINQSYYSQKIQEYNYFAKKVNDAVAALKNIIDIYNVEVAEYNSCINL